MSSLVEGEVFRARRGICAVGSGSLGAEAVTVSVIFHAGSRDQCREAQPEQASRFPGSKKRSFSLWLWLCASLSKKGKLLSSLLVELSPATREHRAESAAPAHLGGDCGCSFPLQLTPTGTYHCG